MVIVIPRTIITGGNIVFSVVYCRKARRMKMLIILIADKGRSWRLIVQQLNDTQNISHFLNHKEIFSNLSNIFEHLMFRNISFLKYFPSI